MKEVAITDFSHDWVIVFSCATKKFYSADLENDGLREDEYDDWINELIKIEKMTSKEFLMKYDNDEDIEILSPLEAFLNDKERGGDIHS